MMHNKVPHVFGLYSTIHYKHINTVTLLSTSIKKTFNICMCFVSSTENMCTCGDTVKVHITDMLLYGF